MSEESKQYPVEFNFQSELSLYGTSEYVSFRCYEMELTIPSATKHDGDQWREVSKWLFDYSIWLDKYWGQGCSRPVNLHIKEECEDRSLYLTCDKQSHGDSCASVYVSSPGVWLSLEQARLVKRYLEHFIVWAETEKRQTP